jgi:hypothetical protein
MSTNLFTQWVGMSQEALKKFNETQTAVLNNLLQQQPLNVVSMAEMMKASMQSFQQLTNNSTAAFNNLVSNQATSLKLNVSAEALQKLTELMGSLTNRAIQQQTALAVECMKSFTHYLSKLHDVKNPEDLMGLQTKFVEDLSATLKTGASENAELLSSLQTSMTTWTEKTLDNTIQS